MKKNSAFTVLRRLYSKINRPSELTEAMPNYNFEENPAYNKKIIKAKEQIGKIKNRIKLRKIEESKYDGLTKLEGISHVYIYPFCTSFQDLLESINLKVFK